MTAAATVIDGKAIAAEVRAEVAQDVARLPRKPGLATILVGDDEASAIYVANKQKACREVGIEPIDHRPPGDATQEEVAALIARLNADPAVSGILLQLPVPAPLDGPALTALIDPGKDVDGLTPLSAGLLAQGRPGLRPCTPSGVLELLDRHDVALEGAQAVVVGRSILVGKPVAQLLLARHATVTVAHSRTADLEAVCARADVLVAAVGIPRLIGAGHVKPGAAVIDVGVNRTEEGLAGDVDFDAVAPRAGLITPVPGGVGPMTIAMLLRNTVFAARASTVAPEGEEEKPTGR
ncbi:MAG TPA: bifunctional methylenetetrahydrofolate dehydrogenase/methenyltetrahydrofolate cyclohydrolase FolD [Solirubrobacteraceae bacterium]|nr:bifunctional methylenetetrahydrofolate dehydrogenase/methenyltetrahydrofolate cyclohydrolase FolD [Solirubrobacteraceae bacterium]